ncbi:polyamine-transporting ATPase [Hypericibacter terrae]|jgi:ABC-type Fe3+/spermidine/putrescine transport system ATPase subunit|uniref:Polyamine-transporting ATPase n=1 Tax=Hypericibacter terrae TaxID=2602015 RepID=A0A5J6MM64_9PROT|nr:ABC transporter ATP-binding protein [Hypericibacter terrae]QEX18712.1 polyamine-transporting ATPase [Hypericibacter terrae]
MARTDTHDADLLEIVDLKKSFGSYEALKGVSLTVRQGEFMALVGPSGCGKTTLLKHVAGFEEPTAGTLRIDGKEMVGVPPAQRPTSMVFQRLALFPHMTVAQNIGFPLKLRKMAHPEIEARVRAMITLMELRPEYLGRYPRQLSGGEQQRVALARSMVSEPKLLLLDEPLSALDVKLKKVLQAELKRLHRSLGVTFLHVTHDLEEAMMLADRICVMRAGEILQIGRPDDIYYRPANAFVAGFIGETNLFPVDITSIEESGVGYRSGEIQDATNRVPRALAAKVLAEGAAHMMVRPELIHIARSGVSGGFDCRLPASITELFVKGGTIQYRARSSLGQDIVFEMPGTSERPADIGDKVELGWNKADIFLFCTEA